MAPPKNWISIFFPLGFFYSFNVGAQGPQPFVDLFIAAVDHVDVVYAAFPFGAQGGDQQGNAGSYVGAGDFFASQLRRAYDDRPVGIAQHDPGAHAYEAVDEEQPRLEHFFVYEDRALALGGHRQEKAQYIRRHAGPDGTLKFRYHIPEARVYLHLLLGRNEDVGAFDVESDAELGEGFGQHRYGGAVALSYGYGVLGGGRQGYEAGHFDVVGVDGVLAALELGDALDDQAVAADAGNIGAHFVQHKAELLDVGFAGGVVDDGLAGSQHRGHDEVFRAGHRGFVQEHILPLQPASVYEQQAFLVVIDGDAQRLQAQKVGGDASGADLVSAGQRQAKLPAAVEQGSGQADGGPYLGEVVFRDVARQNVLGGDAPGVRIVLVLFYFRAQGFQKLSHDPDVADKGDVVQCYGFRGQKAGRQDWQRFVFVAVGCDRAGERLRSFYDE